MLQIFPLCITKNTEVTRAAQILGTSFNCPPGFKVYLCTHCFSGRQLFCKRLPIENYVIFVY